MGRHGWSHCRHPSPAPRLQLSDGVEERLLGCLLLITTNAKHRIEGLEFPEPLPILTSKCPLKVQISRAGPISVQIEQAINNTHKKQP